MRRTWLGKFVLQVEREYIGHDDCLSPFFTWEEYTYTKWHDADLDDYLYLRDTGKID